MTCFLFSAIENDPNAETLRLLETVACYKKHYDLPLVLEELSQEDAFDIKVNVISVRAPLFYAYGSHRDWKTWRIKMVAEK